MKERLVDLIEKSGMVETRKRCEIIADELLAAGVCFAPVEIVIRKDITDDMLRQVQNAFLMPSMIMPYTPGEESVEIIPRWIPVSERLPEMDQPCLCYKETHGKAEYKLGTYFGAMLSGNCAAFKSMSHYGVIGVTHWMPLPEPPKEVQK